MTASKTATAVSMARLRQALQDWRSNRRPASVIRTFGHYHTRMSPLCSTKRSFILSTAARESAFWRSPGCNGVHLPFLNGWRPWFLLPLLADGHATRTRAEGRFGVWRKQDERARWSAVVPLALEKCLFLNVRREYLLVPPFGKKSCNINKRLETF
jgi:hypothetical protein